MITLDERVLDDIRAHVAREAPREACGTVIVFKGRQMYEPCRNLAEGAKFVLDPRDYAACEDKGEVLMIVHSHVNVAPEPSDADRVSCESSGVPWLIMNWPTYACRQFAPSGYCAPLIGRSFHHGVLDCYTLVRDYYREELGIALPDFARDDLWWEKGQNLYLDNFESAGFARVHEMHVHDVLLMMVASKVPNHAAILIADNLVLHHMMNRLSSRDVYGGWYRKITTHTLRHRELS